MVFVNFTVAEILKRKKFKDLCIAHYMIDADESPNIIFNLQSYMANYSMLYSCNSSTLRFNNNTCDAPTISQTLTWILKNYNIIITPWYEEKYKQWTYLINQKRLNSTILYNSKEEAELNGIEFVLKNII